MHIIYFNHPLGHNLCHIKCNVVPKENDTVFINDTRYKVISVRNYYFCSTVSDIVKEISKSEIMVARYD